jgi:hypothetical protein
MLYMHVFGAILKGETAVLWVVLLGLYLSQFNIVFHVFEVAVEQASG